jgi:hypothetical protein
VTAATVDAARAAIVRPPLRSADSASRFASRTTSSIQVPPVPALVLSATGSRVGALNAILRSPPNGDARVVPVVDGTVPSDADALLPPRARSRPPVKDDDDLFVKSRIDRAIFADNARSASCAFFRACSIARSIALTRFDGDIACVASFANMVDDADATGEPTSRSYAADEVVDDGDDRRNESGGTDALVDIAMVRFADVGARARVRVSGCVVVCTPTREVRFQRSHSFVWANSMK